MIGRLRGVLIEKQPPNILIDVSGLAYEVCTSMTTCYQLPDVGGEVVLHTHFIVREDAQQLYGFYDLSERTLFRTLIKVNGVGPKMAITLLSSISPLDFARCVAEQDIASLVRLPGVGKKTAERLVVEMRDRLSDWQLPLNISSPVPQTATQDAVSALISLGYSPQEASRAVSQVDSPNIDSTELIRLALQQMGKKA